MINEDDLENYELVEHELAEGVFVYCMCSTSSSKDFIDRWIADEKRQESFDNFTVVVTRIIERGVASMGNSQKLRCVDGKLGLYEIKNYFSAQRVMAIMHNGVVMLFEYEAHKGGNKKNDPRIMRRARKLAEIARALIEKELGEQYGD